MSLPALPRLSAAAAGLLLALAVSGALADETSNRIAIFAAELSDPTLPYGRKPPPETLKRLDLITSDLRNALVEKAGLDSVDLAPQAEEIRKQEPFYKCDGCAGDIAKAAGAALTATILAERGSTQIYNLSVTITEAGSGKVVRRGQVVISANTDDDWRHAMRWIVKNRLLAEPLPNRS